MKKRRDEVVRIKSKKRTKAEEAIEAWWQEECPVCERSRQIGHAEGCAVAIRQQQDNDVSWKAWLDGVERGFRDGQSKIIVLFLAEGAEGVQKYINKCTEVNQLDNPWSEEVAQLKLDTNRYTDAWSLYKNQKEG